jgi:hypothetical protein
MSTPVIVSGSRLPLMGALREKIMGRYKSFDLPGPKNCWGLLIIIVNLHVHHYCILSCQNHKWSFRKAVKNGSGLCTGITKKELRTPPLTLHTTP